MCRCEDVRRREEIRKEENSKNVKISPRLTIVLTTT
jgi:hypothetical protein